MPDIDDGGDPGERRRAAPQPAPPSRRSVLRGAASAGAAGIAATAFAGLASPASASARMSRAARTAGPAPSAAQGEQADTETVIVHVRNAGAGEIDVFRGTSHTRLHDRELAARLVRASR